jgi:flagellar hook assembly protein FlgD
VHQYQPGSSQLCAGASLDRTCPNPFRSSTAIYYYLCEETVVRLAVHDTMGRKVRHILGPCTQSAGSHSMTWDGRDGEDRDVAPGIYVVRLETAGDVLISRVALIE